jgi:hypothetical protein
MLSISIQKQIHFKRHISRYVFPSALCFEELLLWQTFESWYFFRFWRIQRVLCICCPDKSAAIKAILEYQQVVSIYLCKKHYGPEKNPVYDRRVRDDVELTPTSGWEFKGRLDLLQVCMRYRYNGQVLNELHRLRVIEQRSLSTPQIAIQAMEWWEYLFSKSKKLINIVILII